MRNRNAERELVEKLDALANDAERRERALKDRGVDALEPSEVLELAALGERSTNYRHAATMARGILDVRP